MMFLGTDFSLGLNGFSLALVEFSDGLTPPKDVAHPRVTHAHHAHRYQVGEHGENYVISAHNRR